MKKNYLLLSAVAIAMLGSCSDDVMDISMDEALAVKDVPVSFGTYMGKNATTRAGETDPIDLAKLKEANYGFGVFGYDTKAVAYKDVVNTSSVRNAQPNFMYNEHVTWDNTNTTWTYSPVKYWPNAFATGDVDNQTPFGAATAASGDEHKLSFFAYAPYVNHLAAAGLGSTGITAIEPANNGNGDPVITYKLTTNGDPNVDLLWGTAFATDNSVLGTTQSGTKLTGGLAAVNLDLVKQKTNGKVAFSFKHALTNVGGGNSNVTDGTAPNPDGTATTVNIRKGGLQIMLDADEKVVDPTTGAAVAGSGIFDKFSRVHVNSIKITGYSYTDKDPSTDPDGTPETADPATTKIWIADGGALNLATGVWKTSYIENAAGTTPTNTIDLGIVSQPTAPATLAKNESLLHANIDNSKAKPVGDANFQKNIGVLTTPQNVYNDNAQPLVFMPKTIPHLTVEVDYVVRTDDPKLADKGTTVHQVITKVIELPVVEQNKQYNLIIHLGMTSIKFDATVQDWTGTPAGGSDPVNPGTGTGTPGSTPSIPASSEQNVPVYVPVNVL